MKSYRLPLKKTVHRIFAILKEDYLFLLIGLVLVILLGEILMRNYMMSQILGVSIAQDPFPDFHSTSYPVLQNKYAPAISAQAAYIWDLSSRVVIYSKNEDLRFAPASTTKLVTALTALDYFQPDDILTAKNPQVEPVVLGLISGEKMTFQNLLYAMLVPSANDAAFTITQNYPGGLNNFVEKMNEKVALFHLQNTHYADPIGLKDDEDYTTVHDLARIFSYALSHPLLSKVLDTNRKIIQDTNGKDFTLVTTNKLLGNYGVNAGKTGYTEEAGEVLVTSAEMNNGHTYILVVMKSEDRFADTQKLLELIQDNIIYQNVNL